MQLGNGDQNMVLTEMVPDDVTQGDVTVTFKTRFYRTRRRRRTGRFLRSIRPGSGYRGGRSWCGLTKRSTATGAWGLIGSTRFRGQTVRGLPPVTSDVRAWAQALTRKLQEGWSQLEYKNAAAARRMTARSCGTRRPRRCRFRTMAHFAAWPLLTKARPSGPFFSQRPARYGHDRSANPVLQHGDGGQSRQRRCADATGCPRGGDLHD